MEFDCEKGYVFLLDKPLTWTSFDVVNKIRYALKRNLFQRGIIKKNIKVGHAGTLDPLASGLLIICAGKETKNINNYVGMVKEYTGNFFLGATTPSFDKETEVENIISTENINEDFIRVSAAKFIGEQQQFPPIFSAIKKDGKKSYVAARAGIDLKLDSRTIVINEFEITDINIPIVSFRIVCSKGTYIRSIANDFGKSLGCGAYLHDLRRTKIGDFNVLNAVSVEKLIADFNPPKELSSL